MTDNRDRRIAVLTEAAKAKSQNKTATPSKRSGDWKNVANRSPSKPCNAKPASPTPSSTTTPSCGSASNTSAPAPTRARNPKPAPPTTARALSSSLSPVKSPN